MPQLQTVVANPSAGVGSLRFTQEAHAMQRAVIRLFDLWGLNESQAVVLLGGIAIRTYQRWKRGEYGRVNIDLQERLSLLMGIHKALRLLFKEPRRGYEWVQRPNTVFAGRSALDLMLDGRLPNLMRVRQYLDAG